MPFVMITRDAVAMRRDLCAGRPVELALLAKGPEAPLASPATRSGTAHRLLFGATWETTSVSGCAGPGGGATNPATAPAPAMGR